MRPALPAFLSTSRGNSPAVHAFPSIGILPAAPNIANQGAHVTRTDCTSEHHVRHAAPAIPSGAPLLQAGLTCWRVARADRLASHCRCGVLLQADSGGASAR